MDAVEFIKNIIIDIEESISQINKNIISKISDKKTIEYERLIKEIDENRVETLIKKSTKEFKIINDLLTKYKEIYFENWKKYNTNYQVYLQIIVRDINEEFNNIKKLNDQITEYNFKSFELHINKIEKLNKNSDIMLPFSSSASKKYIVFGKNGTGKTKLLNLIKKRIFGNAYYIPACRNVFENEKSKVFNDKKLETLSWGFDTLIRLFTNLVFKELQYEESSHALPNGSRISNSYELFLKMYDELDLSRKIKINFEKKTIELYNDIKEIPAYDISNASDGEKSIIQFLIYIFLVPQNSYIIIDEPELHINPAILKDFFDCIEEFRQDLVFVYSSHNIEFIESRENTKLLYIKGYNGEVWDYEYLEDKNLEIEQILEIIGSKKPIIYIEGNQNSIDRRIYPIIFKEFNVISLSTCAEVIKVCKSIKRCKLNYNGEIYGIIDNDFRDPETIEKYEKSNIYTLPCSEVENLLFHPLIIKYILEKYKFNYDNKIDRLKEEIIQKMKFNNRQIIEDFINKKSEMFNNEPKYRYTDRENLKNNIEKNFNQVMSRFLNEFDNFVEKLENDLNSDVYERIYIYPNKNICSSLKKINLNFSDYLNWINISIEEDEEFRKMIISKIFRDFMYDKRYNKLTPKNIKSKLDNI